jgi:hypothetical protein
MMLRSGQVDTSPRRQFKSHLHPAVPRFPLTGKREEAEQEHHGERSQPLAAAPAAPSKNPSTKAASLLPLVLRPRHPAIKLEG